MPSASPPLPRSYEVRTYGCQMNVHDSERLAGLLPRLSPRDREIVERRLLDGDESLTMLGVRLGVTRERVRQLELRLMKHLRAELADLAEALQD